MLYTQPPGSFTTSSGGFYNSELFLPIFSITRDLFTYMCAFVCTLTLTDTYALTITHTIGT